MYIPFVCFIHDLIKEKEQRANFPLLNMVPPGNVFLCGMASCHLCEVVLHIPGTALTHNSSQQAKCHGRALVGGWAIPGAVLNWASCSALVSVLLTQGLDNTGLLPATW